MSSRLPVTVTRQVLKAAEVEPGRYQCSGYGRRRHGSYTRSQVAVDHVIPERDGGEVESPANLQVLCAGTGSCHSRKTADEARKRAKGSWSPVGWVIACAIFYGVWLVVGGALEYLMARFNDGLAHDQARAAMEAWLSGQWANRGWVLGVMAAILLIKPLSAALRAWVRMGADKPEKPPATRSRAPGPDLGRVEEAVREVVGQKGEVVVAGINVKDIHGFAVTYVGTGFADHVDDRRVDLEARVSAKVGGRWLTRWDTQKDIVHFMPRPPLPDRVEHPGFAPTRAWNILPVGVSAAGPVEFDLLITPHVLVQGSTGSGKTVLLRNVIAAMVDTAERGEAILRIGDPKRIEMTRFKGQAGIETLATSEEALWHLATDARDEMMRRYDAIEAGETTLEELTPLLIVLDEYEEWIERMKIHYVESGKKKAANNLVEPPAVGAMKSVLRMGRAARVHVVLGTQRPDAAIMGGASRDLLQGRALVGRATAEASRMCFGVSTYGRDVPLNIKGRATFQTGDDSEPVEGQVYLLGS